MNLSNPVGGYFELENFRKNQNFHPNSIELNTGRNALEYIIISRKIKKIYIPFYTCEVILEPLIRNKVEYEFYGIDRNMELLINPADKTDGFVLYTNYFGLKTEYIENNLKLFPNIIYDFSQAFFSKSVKDAPTFYSCRKFFGVPDGAYLFDSDSNKLNMEEDISYQRFSHLLKRIDLGAENGYPDFKENDQSLSEQPIKKMSRLTRYLMSQIDYNFVSARRKANYQIIHNLLGKFNELPDIFPENAVPMVYPFLLNSQSLHQKLIENKIYVAKYWPNVLKLTSEYSMEYNYADKIIPLPIDQRYNAEDMKILAEKVIELGKL